MVGFVLMLKIINMVIMFCIGYIACSLKHMKEKVKEQKTNVEHLIKVRKSKSDDPKKDFKDNFMKVALICLLLGGCAKKDPLDYCVLYEPVILTEDEIDETNPSVLSKILINNFTYKGLCNEGHY